MERFVLILDASIANGIIPEWIHDLYIEEELPYCLHINIGSFTNKWVQMNEFQSKIKSFCNNNNNDINNELDNHVITTIASYVHNACCELKSYLSNSNITHFALELIWKFPEFNHEHNNDPNLEKSLMLLCGAFQRFIECNNGHIHIITQNTKENINHSRNNDDNIDLCDIDSWSAILEGNCTIWNRKDMDHKTWIEILKPHRLNTVQLHMEYCAHHDANKMDVDCDNNDGWNSFAFDFDLIPTFLHKKDSTSLMQDTKQEILWKNWSNCYAWNTMKILNVIDKASFPSYLLLSDIKHIMQYTQNEPVLLLLHAQNDAAQLLTSYWLNGYDNGRVVGWIVHFVNDEHMKQYYGSATKLARNAFVNEDEWSHNYVESEINDDDIKNDDSEILSKTQESSKYLVYPVFIENKMRLIAHRIMSEQHAMHANILNLTYKYSANMDVDTMQDVDLSQIHLPYFRYKEKNGEWMKCETQHFSLTDNEITAYNRYLLKQHKQHMDECVLDKRSILPPTPAIATSSSSSSITTSASSVSSSSTIAKLQNTAKRKKRRRKKSLTNRGLIAIQMAAKQSKNIQSAHLMQRTKRVRNVPLTCVKKRNNTKQQRKRLNFSMKKEEKECWLNTANLMKVFDKNGELKDKAKEKCLQNISIQHNAARNNWRKLRKYGEMNGNWPIKSRFYNEESKKYEEQISRIKKQYVNGSNNGNNSSFEIIGDLAKNVTKYRHRITIKCDAIKINKNTTTNNGKNGKNNKDFKIINRTNLQFEIEALLKKQLNKTQYGTKYRKIRSSILDLMWKDIMKSKNVNAHKKIDKKIFNDYVTKHFGGMFLVFNMQY